MKDFVVRTQAGASGRKLKREAQGTASSSTVQEETIFTIWQHNVVRGHESWTRYWVGSLCVCLFAHMLTCQHCLLEIRFI